MFVASGGSVTMGGDNQAFIPAEKVQKSGIS